MSSCLSNVLDPPAYYRHQVKGERQGNIQYMGNLGRDLQFYEEIFHQEDCKGEAGI